jgi:hypothetical protein
MLLSINKILMLIAILAAVWYGFKLVGRLDKARGRKPRRFGFPGMKRGGAKDEPEIVDLVRGADGKTFTARKTDEQT